MIDPSDMIRVFFTPTQCQTYPVTELSNAITISDWPPPKQIELVVAKVSAHGVLEDRVETVVFTRRQFSKLTDQQATYFNFARVAVYRRVDDLEDRT